MCDDKNWMNDWLNGPCKKNWLNTVLVRKISVKCVETALLIFSLFPSAVIGLVCCLLKCHFWLRFYSWRKKRVSVLRLEQEVRLKIASFHSSWKRALCWQKVRRAKRRETLPSLPIWMLLSLALHSKRCDNEEPSTSLALSSFCKKPKLLSREILT